MVEENNNSGLQVEAKKQKSSIKFQDKILEEIKSYLSGYGYENYSQNGKDIDMMFNLNVFKLQPNRVRLFIEVTYSSGDLSFSKNESEVYFPAIRIPAAISKENQTTFQYNFNLENARRFQIYFNKIFGNSPLLRISFNEFGPKAVKRNLFSHLKKIEEIVSRDWKKELENPNNQRGVNNILFIPILITNLSKETKYVLHIHNLSQENYLLEQDASGKSWGQGEYPHSRKLSVFIVNNIHKKEFFDSLNNLLKEKENEIFS